MPSTYTLNNGIELIGTGEQSGSWGDTTNTNFELIDTALDGQVTVTLASAGTSGSPNALPISDGASSNGRNRMIIFNDGADLGATAYVQLTPNDAEKIVYIRNDLSGSRSIIVFQGTYNASNDYEIPAGTTAVIYFNGGGAGAVAANVFNNAYFDSLRLGGVSVTAIIDDDTMATAAATNIPTAESVKAYVDAQVGANNELSEVLANGNTTGGTSISVNSTDNILFGDNNKAIFGAGSDLQIYHTGAHSYIDDQGTGNLYLNSNGSGTIIQGGGTQARFFNGAGVDLWYNNAIKLATTSTGVDVTGTVTADALTVSNSSANADIVLTEGGTNTDARIRNSNGILQIGSDINNEFGASEIQFSVDGKEFLTVDRTGDISFYEDTGTTPKFFWDASAEALGIGTSSPAQKLHVAGNILMNNSGELRFIDSGGTQRTAVSLVGNDLNVGTSAGGNLKFYNGSSYTERMRIDSSGNVGIGTSSPAGILQLKAANPDFYITSDNTGQSDIYFGGTTTPTKGRIQFSDNSDFMAFWTNSTQRMTINSSGNVGIGTTAPQSDLEIQSKTTGTDAVISLTAAGTRRYQIKALTSVGALAFVDESLASERMRIDSSGNVGIGTSSPNNKAQVSYTSVAAVPSAGAGGHGFAVGDSGFGIAAGALTSGNGYLQATRWDGSATNYNLILQPNGGSVGIGTSSPAQKLHVSTAGNNYIVSHNTAGSTSALLLGAESGSTSIYSWTTPTGSTGVPLKFFTGASEAMRIDSSGNVGIGLTPSNRLDVFGGVDGTIAAFGNAQDNAHLMLQAAVNYGSNNSLDNKWSLRWRGRPNAGGHSLAFYDEENSAERMRIDSSGNVGIGVVPNATGGGYKALQLGLMTNWAFPSTGSAYRSHNLYYDGTTRKYVTTGTAHEYEQSSAGHVFSTAASGTAGTNVTLSEAMRIDSSGNVLIGTPTAVSNNRLVIEQASGDGANSGFYLQRNGAAGQSFKIDIDSSDVVSFRRSTVQAMTITSTGSVGINTTSPNEPLTVLTNTSSQGINVVGRTTDGQSRLHFTLNDGTTETATLFGVNNAFILGASQATGYMIFRTGGTTERMRIDSSGVLSIGTTSITPGISNTGVGHAFNPNGYAAHSRDNNDALFVNRNGTNGDIISIRKDGAEVGSISVVSGLYTMYNSNNNTGFLGSNGSIYYGWDTLQFYPNTDNARDLGISNRRWDDVYATNGTIQTSDRNEKQDIAELDEAERRVAVAAKGLLRKFRWKDAVAEKGDDARIHFGIIAQDLQAAFAAEGLDAGRYGMFIHTTWTDEETGEERSRMGVRYSELLAFIIAAI